MKRKKLLWGLIGLVAVAPAPLLQPDSWEQQPQRVYERNKDALNTIAERYLEDGSLQYPAMEGVLQVNAWGGKAPILELMTSCSGVAPASRYRGIYYSVNGGPAAAQGADAKLELQDDGCWIWQGEGDNGGRTKQIEGSWYVFEAWF